MFTEQLPDLLDYVNNLPGVVCLVGDMNIHFDNPLQSLTKQTLTTLSLHSLVQVINKPTHRCGHIIDWVIVRPDDDIHKKYTVTDSLESDHYCTKSYFNVSVSKPSTLCRTVRNIANIDCPSFIAELSSVSEFSSVGKANKFCDFLRTVLEIIYVFVLIFYTIYRITPHIILFLITVRLQNAEGVPPENSQRHSLEQEITLALILKSHSKSAAQILKKLDR